MVMSNTCNQATNNKNLESKILLQSCTMHCALFLTRLHLPCTSKPNVRNLDVEGRKSGLTYKSTEIRLHMAIKTLDLYPCC